MLLFCKSMLLIAAKMESSINATPEATLGGILDIASGPWFLLPGIAMTLKL